MSLTLKKACTGTSSTRLSPINVSSLGRLNPAQSRLIVSSLTSKRVCEVPLRVSRSAA